MPSELGPQVAVGGIRVTASPVIDFLFGLFSLSKSCNDPDKPVPAWVNEIAAANPELARRLGTFWADRGLADQEGTPYFEWGELLVAAWRIGLIFTPDVSALLDGLDAALRDPAPTPPLYSEPRTIEELIDRRMRLLREKAADRAEYASLLREFWTALAPYWDADGRVDAARAVAELSARIKPDIDLRTLLPGNHFLHKDEFQPQITGARTRGELVIVPLGLGGAGQLYWSLPGIVLVGAGIENAEREARKRERAERAAARFKVLSDPTRLNILMELLRPGCPNSSVTELASLFGLSQPTVSVHVKMLREAGLVRAEKDGNQVRYQAEDSTVRAFLDEAQDEMFGTSLHRR
jgi:DNA-binding transcriptional ArsR family regulator